MDLHKGDDSSIRGVRVRRLRKFAIRDAVNPSTEFYIEPRDLDSLTDKLFDSTWLLITGPWQSGKSSLMYRLAERVANEGFLALVTTLCQQMVEAANDPSLSDRQAGDAFFKLLARAMVRDSRGSLVYHGEPGWDGILDMLTQRQHIIWFIDEAAYLNEIRRPGILKTLLGGLRTCKQDSKAGGPSSLHSFALIGTDKTYRLLKAARDERIQNELMKGGTYVPSSPQRQLQFDSYYPFAGSDLSPLGVEVQRASDLFDIAGIAKLLEDYRDEHGVVFRQSWQEVGAVNNEERQSITIRKYASSIFSLTNGHKGMVGCCCGYLSTKTAFATYTEWKRRVRLGYVAAYLFYASSYSKMVSRIADYSKTTQEIILQCVMAGTSVTVRSDDLDELLPAINDGLLRRKGLRVTVSCNLLLQAMLEDSRLAPLAALPPVHSFTEALQLSFSYININRLANIEVLNANGQPSEYIWQSEVLLSSKFILENAYRTGKYTILVEAKKREKNGWRLRLDFLFKNANLKGCEIQGAGNEDSVKKHIKKSDEKYRVQYGCEMHYMYLQYGAGVLGDPKAVIARESRGRQLTCWFVQYVPDERVWNVERLEGSNWVLARIPAATTYPEFMFGTRRDTLYTAEELYET